MYEKSDWVPVKEIQERFRIKRTHARALIKEMRTHRKWRTSVVAYDHLLRVNLADFERFWRQKSVIKELG